MYGTFASAFQEGILSSIDGPPLCAGEEEGRVQSVVSHDIISYNILATILCKLLAFSRVNVFLRHRNLALVTDRATTCMLNRLIMNNRVARFGYF